MPDVVYVERVQTDMDRRDLDRTVGSRTGAAATLLASGERVRLATRTLVDFDVLLDRLAVMRARGHAISDGKSAYGLRLIAAPAHRRAPPHALRHTEASGRLGPTA